MGAIRIGTSGFSYEDWRGFFYPEGLQKKDMLEYYAEHFHTVEVNSTYYAIPLPSTFIRMSEKTPDHFQFVVKANKDMTHSADVDLEVFKRFSAAIEPIAANGKLGCVLAQYPWSFKKNDANVDRIRQLGNQLEEFAVAVEFRNSGWVGESTFELLRKHNLGFCCVDEPGLKGLMPGIAVATSPVGYVRFHGRNAEKWWQHDEAWERYNYLYSEEELCEWVPKVKQLASSTDRTYLFFNNHYQGKAAQNAQLFAGMLTELRKDDVRFEQTEILGS